MLIVGGVRSDIAVDESIVGAAGAVAVACSWCGNPSQFPGI